MDEHERSFVDTINGMIVEGLRFDEVAREAMRRTMGDTQTDIIVGMVGRSSIADPAALVKGLSRIFGSGAWPLYDSIVAAARASLVESESTGQSVFSQLTEGMMPAPIKKRVGAQPSAARMRDYDEDLR